MNATKIVQRARKNRLAALAAIAEARSLTASPRPGDIRVSPLPMFLSSRRIAGIVRSAANSPLTFPGPAAPARSVAMVA